MSGIWQAEAPRAQLTELPSKVIFTEPRWIAGRGSDDLPGTAISAPSAGPVRMHVWAVDGGRRARPSAADARTPDSEPCQYVKV